MRARRSFVVVSGLAAASLATALVAVACDSGDDDSPVTPSPEAGDAADDVARADGAALDAADAADAFVLVDASEPAIACAATPCAVELAAGRSSICARLSDGTVRCWGDNTSGELGRGVDAGVSSPTPAAVTGLTNVTQLAGAPSEPTDAYCARKADGTVMCWGSNARGVLGRVNDAGATGVSSPVPGLVNGAAAATGIYLGPSVGCATTATNDLTCWGTNDTAQIPPRPLDAEKRVVATTFALGAPSRDLAIADRGTVALAANGSLSSWGLRGGLSGDTIGVLGREVSLEAAKPGALALPYVSTIAGSIGRVCAVANGRVMCWGVGVTAGSSSVAPSLVGIGSAEVYAVSLAVGPNNVCAAMSDGSVQCWGDNTKGQLGNGNNELQALPVGVIGLGGKAVRVAAMEKSTCALLVTGVVQCWGSNDRGQLGLGTADALGHLAPANVRLLP